MSRSLLPGILVTSALLLATGCTSLPPDLGRGQIDQLVAERGYPVDSRTEELLASLTSTPLSAESAMRIALINNPQLQSSYARLGFAAADVYEAGRIRNPVFSAAARNSNEPGADDLITFGLAASFADLITLRARSRLAGQAFTAFQQETSQTVLTMAATAEKAYYNYVGARQIAVLRQQIARAGNLSAALAERFREAGNLAPRDHAMEQSIASLAKIKALEAEAESFAARTELASVMGLSAGDSWQVSSSLQLPPKEEESLSRLLALAGEKRLDLAAAKTSLKMLADQRGLLGWSRWLDGLELDLEKELDTDRSRLAGPGVHWSLPVFSSNRGRLLRADAELQTAVNEVRQIQTDVDNSVRLAYTGLQNLRARIDEFQSRLIPQRIETTARAQEEVNFMLTGVFDLLALKQAEYDAAEAYLGTIRDYWLARADLALAVGASLPAPAGPVKTISAEDLVSPAVETPESEHRHHHHNHE